MELTIEQALLKAVESHKAGMLQDAERLYRAILQAQPKQPDANHNLGVLAISVNICLLNWGNATTKVDLNEEELLQLAKNHFTPK